ncbi:uncharacterized protein LOC113106702 [Carassius auratus]|uniref:Uncharacterized protein LOC113106702 n=1 Tax=Carassius auratus TaxID=7957 RepID=A0A6P6PTV0_CARAU|nr:uncharacterized protein LOC113106702 [Carassius auratus]
MSMTSSEISAAESEGGPDGLHGSRSDTFSIELAAFNRLHVFDLGTIRVYDEIDDSNDGDYTEQSSLGSDTSEDEIGASVVSFESHSDEGGFLGRLNTQMHCGSILTLNRGSDDSLDLLSISSTSSCKTQIIYRAPMHNAPFIPHSNFVDTAWPSVTSESTSIGMTPVDSVDNSTENHVSLRKKMKNRIGSFFKRAWKAIKRPSLSCKTRKEPDPEPADPESSCSAGPSGFKPTDEFEEFGYETGGFSTGYKETPTSSGEQTEDADCLDVFSLSSGTSEDDSGQSVFSCDLLSVQRGNLVHRLGEWSPDSDLFICEGGRDDNMDLLSISTGTSYTEERRIAWQNVPAIEACACSDCRNMYSTGPSMSDIEASPVDTLENSTGRHTNLWKKMKNGISSFFKKAPRAKCPSFCCCCCETRVEPFVPQAEDLEPDPQPAYPKPFFVAEPSGFRTIDDSQEFYYKMVMLKPGSFGFL